MTENLRERSIIFLAVELKKIDLGPLLEHHFNVCGAKI